MPVSLPRNILLVLLLVPLLLLSGRLLAEISYTGGVYIQNFDALASTQNAEVPPTWEWPWADDSTLPGWYASRGSGPVSITSYQIPDGTAGNFDNTGDVTNVGIFSFGSAGAAERALGMRATSSFSSYSPVQISVCFINNTGQTISEVNIGYRGEQWFRSTSGAAHALTVKYHIGADFPVASGTAVPGLTFTAPQSAASVAFLDGNDAANRQTLSTNLTGLSWTDGSRLWIRFTDTNESGTEQGLGVDDFTFSAVVPGGSAPTISAVAPADEATGISTTANLQVSVGDADGEPLIVSFYGRRVTPPPGPDFTLVTLPDTQFYSENSNGTRLNNFLSQTSWIVSQKDALSVAFVAHMGDMVQNGDLRSDNVTPNLQEWLNADLAMDTIEQHGSTLTAYGIPWGGAPGNHDYEPLGDPNGTSIYWNQFFGIPRFEGRPYFQGTYNGVDNNNNYQFFSASGLDFIVINIGYRTSANNAILDWADALMKAYPHRRAIVTSHYLVNTGNPANFGGPGQATYNALRDNPNFFMMLAGHISGEGRRADTFEGRTVYSNLQDYQGRADGGGSWIRYYVFSPSTSTIQAKTYRTTTGQFEVDADSDFTMTYDMQSPLGDWVELGQVPVAGGGTSASLGWPGLDENRAYEWYAIVTDGNTPVASTARSFTTALNTPPTASLTMPTNDQVFNLPDPVNFTATASDPDGSIDHVEFYAGNDLLGEDSSAPYEFQWTGMNGGDYVLTAVAVDNEGAVGLSNAVNITVVNPSNVLPTVSLIVPATGLSAAVPAGVKLIAEASDTSPGTVTAVEFYQGAVFLGRSTAAPYTYTWTTYTPGVYSLTAKAFDDDGGVTTSSPVSLTVFTPSPTSFMGSYSQDFTSLGVGGTVPPPGWVTRAGVPGTHSGIWTTTINVSGNNGVDSLVSLPGPLRAVNTPTATDNEGYNSGAVGNTADRMLASAPGTTSAPESLGVSGSGFDLMVTNDTGAALTDLHLGYEIHRFNAPSPVNELPGYWLFYSLDNGATWANLPQFNSTLGDVPNTVGITEVPRRTLSLASPWAVGERLILRWLDDNSSTGTDQRYGLDDVILARNDLSIVVLNAPSGGAVFAAPATIQLGATASDPGGSIVSVEFFRDNASLGTDSTPPFTALWNGAPVGTYELSALALDNSGNFTISAPLIVEVQVDTDADTMPDAWETAHNLDLNDPADAAANADGDAFTNLQEFQAGTDPQDPADVLTLVPVRNSGGDVTLSFDTVLGRRYDVEARNDLADGGWTTIAENLPGTGEPITVNDPAAAETEHRYYHAIVRP